MSRCANRDLVHYGVFGEGLGHASRALFLVPHLRRAGFDVKLFSSGCAADVLEKCFPECECEHVRQFRFHYRNNSLDILRTFSTYMSMMWWGAAAWRASRRRIARERPVAAISDYEPVLARSAAAAGVPVIALDHQQVLSECLVEAPSVSRHALRSIRFSNRMTYGRPALRVITSFFHPPMRDQRHQARCVLAGPLLREEILRRESQPGRHIVVYQTSPSMGWLDRVLAALPGEKRVYCANVNASRDVISCEFSTDRFLDDLATCRFAVVNGGHTTISEAIYFGKPVVCIPVRGQGEQEVNATYVERLGFGKVYRVGVGEIPDFGGFLKNEHLMRETIKRHRIPPGNTLAVETVLQYLAEAASS